MNNETLYGEKINDLRERNEYTGKDFKKLRAAKSTRLIKARKKRRDIRGLMGIEIEKRKIAGETYEDIQADMGLPPIIFKQCRRIYYSFVFKATGEFLYIQ